jgi:hypothetical protein
MEANGLQIGNKNDILLSQERAEESPEIMSLLNNTQRLNYSSIGHVCGTDPSSVELVLKEIIGQMASFVKKGATLRISFRIGRIEIKNQEVNWKQFAEDYDRNIRSLTTVKEGDAHKRSMTDSRYTKM